MGFTVGKSEKGGKERVGGTNRPDPPGPSLAYEEHEKSSRYIDYTSLPTYLPICVHCLAEHVHMMLASLPTLTPSRLRPHHDNEHST